MTGQVFPTINRTKSGRFKVYMQGSADGHIMDWLGCNFKFVTVKGQPFRGFETKEEAKNFLKELEAEPERLASEVKRARDLPGSYISEDRCEL